MSDHGFIDHINGLSSDSREIKEGFLFAALQGGKYDGRDFIDQAIKNGATHILAPKGTQVNGEVTVIESDNPRHEFALMAATFYKSQPKHIVAVTGTNGKTSVVDFILQILEMMDKPVASIGTLGLISNHVKGDNVMTTPDPVKLHSLLADLHQAGVEYVAMEASSHGLDQYRLDGVNVSVAAFTNLSQDHLDYHGDMESYFNAKSRLFSEILSEDGYAVINTDDQWGQKIDRCEMTFGKNERAALRLLSQTPKADGQDIQIQYHDAVYDIHLPLIGLFQAYNILCAVSCCLMLACDADAVIECLPKLKGVNGRMQLAASNAECAAYIDYAHTPDAMEKALTAIRPHVKGRLICVFGAGGDRDKTKRPLMGAVASTHADIAIITDDNPRSEEPATIRQEIFSACSSAENIGGRKDAIAHAVSILKAGDVLLVAGKGHEQGQTIGTTTHPFDDFQITQDLMEARFKS